MTSAVRPIKQRDFIFARLLLGIVFGGYLKTHVSGSEHLPPPGVAAIIAANHVSALDVFAAGYALARPAYFVAKVEATRYPLLGPLLLAVGAIPSRRDQRDIEVVRRLIAVLELGQLTGLAPEGTRSSDGRLAPYDPGFIWLALRTRAKVVPCAIHGTYQLMPKGAQFPRRGPIWLRFGEAMSFDNESSRPGPERLSELAEAVRQRTRGMLIDLVAETGISNPAVVAGA